MIDTDEGFAPLLVRRARHNPAGLFARYEGAPISFAELDRMASALASWMRRIGLAPGDAVALMLHNSPLALALLFAIAKARAVWVPVNRAGPRRKSRLHLQSFGAETDHCRSRAHGHDRVERCEPLRRASLHD